MAARQSIQNFTDIPNVGPSIAKDFTVLSINTPQELAGRDPYQMYKDLCHLTHQRHDHCVIDVFIAAVRYMEGGPIKKWWDFTAERKKTLAASNV